MGLPRSRYVKDGEEGVYHCYSRCVRRAFLCGYDALTGRNYSHRKEWLVDRLRYLAAVFAIEVIAYAVLDTHYHTILRIRPDIVAAWSDWEVATRWLTLFPGHRKIKEGATQPTEEQIRALSQNSERIAQLRKRLCSLSWFMGRLNEYIAREANKEDGIKGCFWDGRFKCRALLDMTGIISCMVYVDLNLVRAGLAATPEESDFTSIQERIRGWQKEMTVTVNAQEIRSGVEPDLNAIEDDGWLCPISSRPGRRGILQMTATEYFSLVDRSGRMTKRDKPGEIDPELAPILSRIGARPDAWAETISRFGTKFPLAAGLLSSLEHFADRVGRRWVKGVTSARTAFVS